MFLNGGRLPKLTCRKKCCPGRNVSFNRYKKTNQEKSFHNLLAALTVGHMLNLSLAAVRDGGGTLAEEKVTATDSNKTICKQHRCKEEKNQES